ncbi:MAG TPA: hypothetical protein PLK05_03430 [Steroidobacteraceae bacterium]|nr:hypothetical protein [Steroidobacteraceae bacterium]
MRARTRSFKLLALLLALSGASSAHAILLSLDPLVSTVYEGDSFGVNIRVSGLHARGSDEIVSAFDLDVLFNDLLLNATGFNFGSALGDPDLDTLYTFSALGGVADIFQLSFLDDDTLAEAQGGSVLLGQLQFTALNPGISFLTFGTDPLFGHNIVGRNGESLTPVHAIPAVTIIRRVAVPEPDVLALTGFALLMLGWQISRERWRSSSRKPRFRTGSPS